MPVVSRSNDLREKIIAAFSTKNRWAGKALDFVLPNDGDALMSMGTPIAFVPYGLAPKVLEKWLANLRRMGYEPVVETARTGSTYIRLNNSAERAMSSLPPSVPPGTLRVADHSPAWWRMEDAMDVGTRMPTTSEVAGAVAPRPVEYVTAKQARPNYPSNRVSKVERELRSALESRLRRIVNTATKKAQ